MTQNGVPISPEHEAAITARMIGCFTFMQVWLTARQTGLEEIAVNGKRANAFRVADRLLQRERRAGRIKHMGGGNWQSIPLA